VSALREQALEGALSAAGGVPPAVVWIASDEDLLRLEAADRVRASARGAGFDERRVFDVDRAFRVDALVAEAGAMSLFSSRRLLELRFAGKPARELGEALAEAVPALPDDVRLLVTSPRLDRATSESPWFARIVRAGWYVPIPVVERDRLPAWIGARLARDGRRADDATLRLIAERVEGNLLAARQEVDKLALLLPPGPLEADAVRAAVLDVARWDAFDLVGAAVAGDAPRALRCLAGLHAEGTPVPVVLWALADAVRTLARVSAARDAGRPVGQALRDARVWGDRERSYAAALRRLRTPRLRRLLQVCARTDRIAKGVLDGDEWLSLEAIVLELAGVGSLALDPGPAGARVPDPMEPRR
jgi:DNA polymerase-3 subunit delta